jgi:hypothetical protein
MDEDAKNRRRYAYEPLEAALDEWCNRLNLPETTRAVRKLKFMVLGYAWVDACMWHPSTDREEALAWGWQELSVALSGHGQSAMTGVVIDLWTATPKDRWEELRELLTSARAQAEAQTSNQVPRLFLEKIRNAATRTPADGFNLPAVVPLVGPRLREWATKMGMDPDDTEEQNRAIEEYERMGLTEVSGDIRIEASPDAPEHILPGPPQLPKSTPEKDNVIGFPPAGPRGV